MGTGEVFGILKTVVEVAIIVTSIIVTIKHEIKLIKEQQQQITERLNKIVSGDIISIGDRLEKHQEEIDALKAKFDRILYLLEQKALISTKKREMEDER